jgi:uncharacterized membrane protein
VVIETFWEGYLLWINATMAVHIGLRVCVVFGMPVGFFLPDAVGTVNVMTARATQDFSMGKDTLSTQMLLSMGGEY